MEVGCRFRIKRISSIFLGGQESSKCLRTGLALCHLLDFNDHTPSFFIKDLVVLKKNRVPLASHYGN